MGPLWVPWFSVSGVRGLTAAQPCLLSALPGCRVSSPDPGDGGVALIHWALPASLHTDTVTHKCFCTQTRLHTETFTHRHVCTQGYCGGFPQRASPFLDAHQYSLGVLSKPPSTPPSCPLWVNSQICQTWLGANCVMSRLSSRLCKEEYNSQGV